MKNKIYIIIFILCLFTGISKAQLKECGSTDMENQLISQHPELEQNKVYMQQYIHDYIETHKNDNSKDNQTYIIPVVFHIIHTYGSENISDAQVYDEMRILNQDYAKLNPDTNDVIPVFKPIADKANIEFRLATLDPAGNCTNGIEHIFSYRTNFAGDESKLHQWARSSYLNVWVVKTIGTTGTVAGYAYFPSTVNGSLYYIDGVLILSNYIGSIGTSAPYSSRALTHEIGHTLAMFHPWGGTNNPGVACGDDGIDDTPITMGSTLVCNLTQSVCDTPVIENVQNYMDYSYCSKMFTHDQCVGMRGILNGNLSQRDSLWTPYNLLITGTSQPNMVAECAPKADFYSNVNFVCQGGSVTFHDVSWNGTETSRSWTFSNGTPSTSSALNPIITFNTSGWQQVSLTATNANGSNTKTETSYIFVSPDWVDHTAPFSESFENHNSINAQWISVNPENNNTFWQWTNQAAATGNACMMLNEFGDFHADIDELISPSFDLTTVTSATLNFKYSCASVAGLSQDVNDVFKVYTSTNCGQTWSTIQTISGVQLANAGHYSQPFFPNSNQWTQVNISLAQNILTSHNVRFKFEFTCGGNSNNMFLDDVNISGPLGIYDPSSLSISLGVFPNPTSGSFNIKYGLKQTSNIQLGIFDATGRLIKTLINGNQSLGEYSIDINDTDLSKGLYMIKLNDGNSFLIEKLIKF